MQKYRIIRTLNYPLKQDLMLLKTILRIPSDHDDNLLLEMLNAAQEMAEKFIGISIDNKEIELEISSTSLQIKVPIKPIYKIVDIYHIKDEVNESVDPKLYEIDNNNDKILIDKSLLRTHLKIQYYTGFIDHTKIPAPIKQGIMFHTAEMYDKQIITSDLPSNIKAFYLPYTHIKI